MEFVFMMMMVMMMMVMMMMVMVMMVTRLLIGDDDADSCGGGCGRSPSQRDLTTPTSALNSPLPHHLAESYQGHEGS
jgi:hypothetical protein